MSEQIKKANYAEVPPESPETMPFTPPGLRTMTWDELSLDVTRLISTCDSLTAQVETLRGQLDNAQVIISRDGGEIADYARTVERLNKSNETWQRRIAELAQEKQGLYVRLDVVAQDNKKLETERWQFKVSNEQKDRRIEDLEVQLAEKRKYIKELENPVPEQFPCVFCAELIAKYPCRECGNSAGKPFQTVTNKMKSGLNNFIKDYDKPNPKPFPCVSDQFLDEPDSTIHMVVPDEPYAGMSTVDVAITMGELSNQCNHYRDLNELSDKYMAIIDRILQITAE